MLDVQLEEESCRRFRLDKSRAARALSTENLEVVHSLESSSKDSIHRANIVGELQYNES